MNKKSEIISMALKTLSEEGLANLTQPKLAKKLGMRQSHLTYYFPKRSDLIEALLEDFLDTSSHCLKREPRAPGKLLKELFEIISDEKRMRFFTSLIMEARENQALKAKLVEHLNMFQASVAAELGLDVDSYEVELILDFLRGIGLKSLLGIAPPPFEKVDAFFEKLDIWSRQEKTPREKF